MLSVRAQKALEVLRAGGKFRYALESGFRGREQFKMRLRGPRGEVIGGIGYQTKVELEAVGLIVYQHPHDARSSAWPQEWVLAPGASPASVALLDEAMAEKPNEALAVEICA
jgi:hypothetical protein